MTILTLQRTGECAFCHSMYRYDCWLLFIYNKPPLGVYVYMCVCVCVSVCLSVCLSVCVPVHVEASGQTQEFHPLEYKTFLRDKAPEWSGVC